MRDGAANTSEVVETYGALVRGLAVRCRRALGLQTDLEDLVQLGMTGLLEASSRFDASQGVEFSTYAYPWIRGAMLNGARQFSGLSRAQVRAVQRMQVMSEVAGYVATADESLTSAEQIWMTLGAVSDAAEVSDAFDGGDTDAGFEASPYRSTPEAILGAREQRALLHRVLEQLDDDERALLTAYYVEGRSLQELAIEMGATRSWLSRLHIRAVGRARRLMQRLSPLDLEP